MPSKIFFPDECLFYRVPIAEGKEKLKNFEKNPAVSQMQN